MCVSLTESPPQSTHKFSVFHLIEQYSLSCVIGRFAAVDAPMSYFLCYGFVDDVIFPPPCCC